VTPKQRAVAVSEHALSFAENSRLKAIHVSEHLHQGMLTIRVFMVPNTAPDPEVAIVTSEEIHQARIDKIR